MYLEDKDFEYTMDTMRKIIKDYFFYNRINLKYFSDEQKKIIAHFKQKYNKLNYHPSSICQDINDQFNMGKVMSYIHNCTLQCVYLL